MKGRERRRESGNRAPGREKVVWCMGSARWEWARGPGERQTGNQSGLGAMATTEMGVGEHPSPQAVQGG